MSAEDSDRLLRLKSSCATAHSHYDQVVAISQKIINTAFDGLYNEHPDWAKVDYSNKKIGSIKGNLNSPRLLLGGGTGSELGPTSALYIMRFKDGELVILADDAESDDHVEDLAGWNLAVTVDLKAQDVVVVDPNADPDERARQQALWDFIHNKFDIPADYSVSRVYAKLSDAHWRDFDFQNSQFGLDKDGTPRSWSQLIKECPSLETDLQIMLSRWARAQEDNGFTTSGIKITPPQPESYAPIDIRDNDNGRSFFPTAMIHQVYPYINPTRGVEKPVISYDAPGDLNSLLYCEMVENNPLPGDQQLASVGNFTSQALSVGGPRIDGTFCLSHQLFLGRFLLPMLQAFNKASIIYTLAATFEHSSLHWSYDVGCGPDHQGVEDKFYSFKPVYNPETPNDATAYQWTWENVCSLPPSNTNGDIWGSFISTSRAQIDFQWNAGGKSFSLTGRSVYKYDAEYSSYEDMQQPWGWLRDAYQCDWNMTIRIDRVEGGVLEMTIDAGAEDDCNAKLVMTQHEQQECETPKGQKEDIENRIREQITNYVKTLKKRLSQTLQTTGRFTYPGHGTFDFSDPMIGNTGEILATIAYKPPPSKDNIKLPEVYTPVMKSMTHFPFQTTPVKVPFTVPIPNLAWSYSKPVKGASESVEILISGKNNTHQAISLVGVALTLLSESSGHGLITDDNFKADKWTIGKPDKTKRNIFQLVAGTDGTEAFVTATAVAGEKNPDGTIPVTFSGVGNVSIAPGDSLKLALLTRTGVPNTYEVSITETWPEMESRASQSLPGQINVILSP